MNAGLVKEMRLFTTVTEQSKMHSLASQRVQDHPVPFQHLSKVNTARHTQSPQAGRPQTRQLSWQPDSNASDASTTKPTAL